MSDGKGGRKAEGEGRGEKKEKVQMFISLHIIQSKCVCLSYVVKEVMENGGMG